MPSRCSFPAADIYTKGPDTADSNEVSKEVLARNTAAAQTLNLRIVYSTADLPYAGVLENLRSIVQTASAASPDIYNNDMYGLCRAMMDIVRQTTDSPFGMQIGVLCQNRYSGLGTLSGMKFLKDNKSWSSTFAAEKDAYNDCMNQMIEKFKTLE